MYYRGHDIYSHFNGVNWVWYVTDSLERPPTKRSTAGFASEAQALHAGREFVNRKMVFEDQWIEGVLRVTPAR